MPRRKDRILVVLDTNIVVGYYLGVHPNSVIGIIFRLWRRERKLQIVVCEDLVSEYMEVLDRLRTPDRKVEHLGQGLRSWSTVTRVNLGSRPVASRDPDDDLILATAVSGRAEFVITDDRDLLEIAADHRRRFRFSIVTPRQFLDSFPDWS